MVKFDSKIDFNIDSEHPYLTQIVGLTDELKKFYKKYPSTYPMKITPIKNRDDELLILTSDATTFIQRMNKMGYSNIFQYRKKYIKKNKDRVVIKEMGSDSKFCIDSKLSVTYFKLLHKKYKMTYNPEDPKKCFTFSTSNLSKMKEGESDYINFIEDKEEEEIDEGEEKEEEKEEEEEEENDQKEGWMSYISKMVFGSSSKAVVTNDLSQFFGDKSDHTKFKGKYAWEWGWLLYLQKELGNDVVCVWEGETGEGGIFYNKKKRNTLEIKEWVIKELNRCIRDVESPFTIGIMTIRTNKSFNHANALIFDRKTKRLFRFEPHGGLESSHYDSTGLDIQIVKWLKQNLGSEWKYKSPNTFCPMVGPQTKEIISYYNKKMNATYKHSLNDNEGPKGYCSAWSLLFLHYRLMNPSLSEEEIVKYMLSHSSDELADKIREYASFISKNVDPNWTLNNKKKALSELDDVQFENRDGKLEYGRIAKKNNENVVVFSINALKRIKDGEVAPYKVYYVDYDDVELLDDNEKDVRKLIRQKSKTYASMLKALKKSN
jgi:hypothetical protein